MIPAQRTPTLKEAITDKKEFEYNLEIAKGKTSQLYTEINELKFNVQSLKNELGELEKSRIFYEAKYNANSRQLCNLASAKRKYKMNIKWFENYKLNMPALSPQDDKFAKAVEEQENLKQQKESLLFQEDELQASIHQNNQTYKEMIKKIKNMDITTLINSNFDN